MPNFSERLVEYYNTLKLRLFISIVIAMIALQASAHSMELQEDPSQKLCSFELEVQEAKYRNGDVALAAAWITPINAPSPLPAVVILQGSGDSDRSNLWAAMAAEQLAKCGVGVLLTDKRGSGASGGDWRNSSMLDLARDGMEGLNWILRQPGTDPSHVGFLGLSQGGRVAPAAASAHPEADFTIGWVTSSATLKESLFYELEQTYRQHGLTDQQIARLQDMAYAAFQWLETGEDWLRYLTLREAIANSELAPGAETWPTTQDDPYWTFWRLNGSYSALPYWRQIAEEKNLPGLVLLGENDAADNVDIISTVESLKEIGAPLKVKVLPNVGHSLMISTTEFHPLAIEETLSVIFDNKH